MLPCDGDDKIMVCDSCDYHYDEAMGDPKNGIPAGMPFKKLSKDWKCPVCGASKDTFVSEDVAID